VIDVGVRIIARLNALGISQSELARRVGVSQPAINHLIRRGVGGSSHIHRIARELQTSPEFLTGETDDDSIDADQLALTSEDREWLELLHALPPKDRGAVLQLARTIAHSALAPMMQSQRQDFER